MPINLHDDQAYHRLLGRIDTLRAKGVVDTHPEMMRLRRLLRDFLEVRNKNKSKTSIVPKLVSVKTVFLGDESKTETLIKHKKYIILGAVAAVAGVIWKLYYDE